MNAHVLLDLLVKESDCSVATAVFVQSTAAGVDFGTDAAAAFLITGGFVYFGKKRSSFCLHCFVTMPTVHVVSGLCDFIDSEGNVVGSKAIVVTKRHGKTVVSKHERHVLQYGDPQSLTAETVANIGRRWQPNTLSFVLERASTHYAWYYANTPILRS